MLMFFVLCYLFSVFLCFFGLKTLMFLVGYFDVLGFFSCLVVVVGSVSFRKLCIAAKN